MQIPMRQIFENSPANSLISVVPHKVNLQQMAAIYSELMDEPGTSV